MSTCSNCGALYPPDDTECPECGIENDRSNLRNRVDTRLIDAKADEEIPTRDNGSALDREVAADDRGMGREKRPTHEHDTKDVEKLEKTESRQIVDSDIPETNNQELKTFSSDESQRAKKTTSRDEDSSTITEPRPLSDSKTENREHDVEGSAAIVESEVPSQNEMLPPAYGSVALAVAEEMDRTIDSDYSQDFLDEQESSDSRSDSDERQQGVLAAEQTAEAGQRETPRSTADDDGVQPYKDETAEQEPIPIRPPVLASEALREQLAPTEPGHNTIRVLLVIVGICGAVIMLTLLGTSGMGLPLAGPFLALLALAFPSIPYAPRAAAVFIISASTLGVVTWMYVETVGTPAEVVETIGVVTLGVALQFRAWHRASLASRFLVAVGILVCMGWLGMSGWLKELPTLDPAWQSWLPTIIKAPFGLLLVLSLLAFMDARTTGGCGIWATAVLFWHALHMTVQLMILVWPKESHAPDWQLLNGELATITAASIASPLLAVLVIFGVSQLLAVASNVDVRARE